MNKHTKGTWFRNEYRQILGSSGQRVCVDGFAFCTHSTEESQANDRRIVACVNACEGFSIEELQGADLFKDSIESQSEITELKKQRDELLEVVREFVQTMDALPDSDETSLRVWDVYDTARKLIERMQRGAGRRDAHRPCSHCQN